MTPPRPYDAQHSSDEPCLESLIVLGTSPAAKSAAWLVHIEASQAFPADPILYQIWWRGQPIGHEIQCVSQSKGFFEPLLANTTLPPDAKAFIVQAVGSQAQRFGSFVKKAEPVAWSGLSSEGPHAHLIREKVFDGFLVDPHPMEALAQEGDLDALAGLLEGLAWDEEDMRAWWRCAESWVSRADPLSFSGHMTQEVGQWDDYIQQGAVLSLLGKYVPHQKVDARKLATLVASRVERVAAHTSAQAFACARLLREVVGDEQAWDMLEMQPGFIGHIPPLMLDWFAGLGEERKGQVLSQSLAKLQQTQQEERVGFITLSEDLPALHEAHPQWEGWDEALTVLVGLDPENERVLDIVDQRNSQRMLEEATSDPQLLAPTPRFRF